MTAALVAGLVAGYGIAVPVGAVGTYLVSLTARTSLRTGMCAALGVATADGLYALVATVGGAAVAAVLRPVLTPLSWASAAVLLALAALGALTAVRQHRARRLATRSTPPPPRACPADHAPDAGSGTPTCGVVVTRRLPHSRLRSSGGTPIASTPSSALQSDAPDPAHPCSKAPPNSCDLIGRKGPSPARAYLSFLGITLLNPTTVVYFAALVLGSGAVDSVRPLEQGVFVLAAFVASASWQLALAGGGALLGRALTGHRGRLVTALVSSAVMTVLAVRMVT
ncbi:LysE family transporter [Streptomyces sp. NPDC002143]